MDLSKLPKLSGDRKSDGPAPQSPEAKPPVPAMPYESAAYEVERSLINGPEIWLSLAIGAILMYLGWEFVQWLIAAAQGRVHDTMVQWRSGEKSGQMVPYWEILGHQALSESAMFLFGFAMMIEAVVLVAAYRLPRLARPLVAGTLVLTVVMTIYNVIAMVVLMKDGIAPLVSMFAVAFGGYMAISQWGLLKRMLA